MTEIKIGDSFEAALQELFSAQLRMANGQKDGWIRGEQKFSIISVTESSVIDNDTIGIEITSAPKVKGMLYEETSYFMFCVESKMYLVPASQLVKLVEELHSDKVFSKKPERGHLLRTKEDKVYGFIGLDDIISLAHGYFNYSPPHEK